MSSSSIKYRLKVTLADANDPGGIDLLSPVVSVTEAEDMAARMKRMDKGGLRLSFAVMVQKGTRIVPAPKGPGAAKGAAMSTLRIVRGTLGSATLTWSDAPGAKVVLAHDIAVRQPDGQMAMLGWLNDEQVRQYYIEVVRPGLSKI